MHYKIANIFSSIQGEGSFIGEAFSFVRFHGCDLVCHFCDDESHKGSYESLSESEILTRLQNYKTKKVVITGGEPTMQNLNELIRFLQDAGYFVAVETNGLNLANVKNADWITYSPKNLDAILSDGFSEIKFLVDSKTDFSVLESYKTDKPKYLQPINCGEKVDGENMRRCVELVCEHPDFKLSPQLHKYLGVE